LNDEYQSVYVRTFFSDDCCILNSDSDNTPNPESSCLSAVCPGLHSRVVLLAQLPVPCSRTAYTLCRWYCCINNILDTANQPYKPEFEPVGLKKIIFSALAAMAGLILCVTTILNYKFSATAEAAREVNMKLIGKSLLSVDHDGYVLPFEVISVLLIAAMVAAIVVAKKSGPKKSESETLTNQ
jgi:hypothetical protein